MLQKPQALVKGKISRIVVQFEFNQEVFKMASPWPEPVFRRSEEPALSGAEGVWRTGGRPCV